MIVSVRKESFANTSSHYEKAARKRGQNPTSIPYKIEKNYPTLPPSHFESESPAITIPSAVRRQLTEGLVSENVFQPPNAVAILLKLAQAVWYPVRN